MKYLQNVWVVVLLSTFYDNIEFMIMQNIKQSVSNYLTIDNK